MRNSVWKAEIDRPPARKRVNASPHVTVLHDGTTLDGLWTLPMITALAEAIPEAEIEVRCARQQRDVFATSQHVRRVSELDSGATVGHDGWLIDASVTWRTTQFRWRTAANRQIAFQMPGFGWLPWPSAREESVTPVMNHPVYRKLELLCPLGIHATRVDYGMRPCRAAETWGWRYHLALQSRFARPASADRTGVTDSTDGPPTITAADVHASIPLDRPPILLEIDDQPNVSASRWAQLVTAVALHARSPLILVGHPRERIAEVFTRCEKVAVAVPELDFEHLRAVVAGCRAVVGEGLATQLAVAADRPSMRLRGRGLQRRRVGGSAWWPGKKTLREPERFSPEGTQASIDWTGRPVSEVCDKIAQHLGAIEGSARPRQSRAA